jgi:penicillin-binding protein 1A
MINGIIAIEDQRYWEHNGLDPMGILRAGISNVFHPGRGLQGASTISQQLVRNLLLSKGQTFMEKVTRKLKEMILTSRLDSVLENQIEETNNNLSSDELRKEMKNKILELYLNYISFGNNAFGVESASKTYFDKSAKDLDVFEASVLSSIPKGPSVYNPYKNPAKVVGEFAIKSANGEKVAMDDGLAAQIQAAFSQKLTGVSVAKKNSEFTTTLQSLGTFGITGTG